MLCLEYGNVIMGVTQKLDTYKKFFYILFLYVVNDTMAYRKFVWYFFPPTKTI